MTFAIDTSTPQPSVAVTHDEAVLAELWGDSSPSAGRRVLEGAHHALSAAGVSVTDVGRIVVGVGPGGFTGLRIGIATALGLGQALDVPVVGVVSLEGLAAAAAGVAEGGLVMPMTDARRREVFTACYRVGTDGGLDELMAPVAVPVDDLASHLPDGDEPVLCVGTGTRVAALPSRAIVPGLRCPLHRVGASHLVQRVDHGGERPVTPLYARLPDAEVNRRAALAGGGVG